MMQHQQPGQQMLGDGIVLGIPQNISGIGSEPQDNMSHLSPVFLSAPAMNMLAAQQQ